MPEKPPSVAPWVDRTISVETPEHVILEFELAGLGSRAAALLLDGALLLVALVFVVLLLGAGAVPVQFTGTWLLALWILIALALPWGYFTLFEALWEGRTPGKKALGLRVVSLSGRSITPAAAAIRNLLRLIDAQPAFTFLIGMAFVFLQRHNRRLGDLAAGTVVVRDRPLVAAAAPRAEAPRAEIVVGGPALRDEEFSFLERVIGRLDSLKLEQKRRIVGALARQLEQHLGDTGTPVQRLIELYQKELQARRASAGGAHARSGSAALLARQRSEEWEAFGAAVERASRSGTGKLSGTEVLDLASRYRAVAADLARARTYRADTGLIEFLERLTGAGHNILYGNRSNAERRVPAELLRTLLRDFYRYRRQVLASLMLFLIPGVVGFLLLREQPEIAVRILPDGMIARAEQGLAVAGSRGYAQLPDPYLPLMASQIIANNIQVAIAAFAFGMTAGVGTVVILAFNGLFFGAILGLFANYGLAGWILTFVAGHGVLELTAIFIAGAAGFLLAGAIIAPGDYSRRDALILAGRSALNLVALAALLLLLAGTIEGLLSASGAAPAFKFVVSATSAVLVILLLAAGRREPIGDAAEAARATDSDRGASNG